MNPGPSSIFLRHPDSVQMGETDFVSGTSFEPLTAKKAVSFIYEQLKKPRTKSDLVASWMTQTDSQDETAPEIEPLLREMVEGGLLLEIPPGAPVPVDQHSVSKQLLWEAQQQLGAGDWSTAVVLCREAGKDPFFANVAELNVLIARFHGRNLDGLFHEACALSPRLIDPAQACCVVLAFLVARQTGDFTRAKLVALNMARWYESPWDLPTVPSFAFKAGDRVAVCESLAIEPILAALEPLKSAQTCSPEENALLESLVQRYRQRLDGPAKQ